MRISDCSSDVCSSDLLREEDEAELTPLSQQQAQRERVAPVHAEQEREAEDDGGLHADKRSSHGSDEKGAIRNGGQVQHHSDRHDEQAQQDRSERLDVRSEEHTSELQSLMRISNAIFSLKKKNTMTTN